MRTELTAISGARIAATQKIYANDILLMEGRIEACIITLTGKPRRLPESLRHLLTPFLVETDT